MAVEVDKEALRGSEKRQDVNPRMAKSLGLLSNTDRSDRHYFII
jgi:hypothetical protein